MNHPVTKNIAGPELAHCIHPPAPRLYTVKQFAAAHPAFTESSLRNLIFKAGLRASSKGLVPGNGLFECGALIHLGRRVLINELIFLNWVCRNHAIPTPASSARPYGVNDLALGTAQPHS